MLYLSKAKRLPVIGRSTPAAVPPSTVYATKALALLAVVWSPVRRNLVDHRREEYDGFQADQRTPDAAGIGQGNGRSGDHSDSAAQRSVQAAAEGGAAGDRQSRRRSRYDLLPGAGEVRRRGYVGVRVRTGQGNDAGLRQF